MKCLYVLVNKQAGSAKNPHKRALLKISVGRRRSTISRYTPRDAQAVREWRTATVPLARPVATTVTKNNH
jgi:hypothetical protein